ncbi:UDP-Glycosyltransferase/glycogen phosphorylase [Wallemia mellicola CBS 633.66]|uniref:UDP-Glycosyltransferase/glycogen phosphorylase n=1 Tax=Wallemia mellicola (strain ATCC MYA-4683 / CBS 633.66) TaxID=671144 RepID=I4YGS3_WALMC|nr:UDP-Glycosyltransferase/glycogen phosphorylase [Wallemia mellicola CBS 633.66]EIM23165.1 UDP-Glycosyltransferase/glycogen phosphorylase [Wallemia mellicola CBS 633.66]|eukprot:XP_006956561.1 UDP-Glycosyltransferase/glycogen phosphorylase [Wallemia mellicola CBS 633.66]
MSSSTCVAMVSDFYFPSVGGVESHIMHLSRTLTSRGKRVIVITHEYPNYRGKRVEDGVTIYYLPIPILPTTANASLPNFFSAHALLRRIYITENVTIVHAHGALSSLAHEALMHARWIPGIKCVFTDHSLFGFRDGVGILTNKLLRFALCDVDAVICVSQSGKENTTLRAHLNDRKVYVIPNAIISDDFKPLLAPPEKKITIVTVSRLYYRKGIDLLIAAAPVICAKHPDVHFVVGGDGPRMTELERMIERYGLQDRVELLGNIPLGSVRNVMARGQIYLNTSLTESFGIVLLEAASTGLFVVSTKVGGIPEVLPEDMIEFAGDVSQDSVVDAIGRAINVIKGESREETVKRQQRNHIRVAEMYSWDKVAKLTEDVYCDVLQSKELSIYERIQRAHNTGIVAGKIYTIVIMVDAIIALILEFFYPP